MNFDQAFDKLLGHEGGYVNHPDDPGGATRWGVTERVARASGYRGDMREFPVDFAKRIARTAYWDAVHADDMPASVRFDLFDTAYNSGVHRAVVLLQRAAGATGDGVIGPKTMAAVRACNPEALAARFNGHRLDFLNDLKTWPAFGRGWTQRVAENLIAMKG